LLGQCLSGKVDKNNNISPLKVGGKLALSVVPGWNLDGLRIKS